jgi:hypothetical protein
MRMLSAWRWAVIASVAIGYPLFLWLLPRAPTVSVIHAVAEQMSFTVLVPEMSRLRLPGFSARTEIAAAAPRRATGSAALGASKALCPGGLLEPAAGTRITYRRIGDGPMRIVLDRVDDKPVGEFKGQAQPVSRELAKASWLVLEAAEACEGTSAKRFPVQGVAEIGDELRPETQINEPSSAPLLEGRIEIYGRTVDLLAFQKDRRPRIYPVTEMALPPGSRIAEAPPLVAGIGKAANASPEKAPWSGFAMIDETALKIELTTEAPALALYRPGGAIEPEILNVGIFAQLTNDPNIVALQAAAVLLIVMLQGLFTTLIGRRAPPPAGR